MPLLRRLASSCADVMPGVACSTTLYVTAAPPGLSYAPVGAGVRLLPTVGGLKRPAIGSRLSGSLVGLGLPGSDARVARPLKSRGREVEACGVPPPRLDVRRRERTADGGRAERGLRPGVVGGRDREGEKPAAGRGRRPPSAPPTGPLSTRRIAQLAIVSAVFSDSPSSEPRRLLGGGSSPRRIRLAPLWGFDRLGVPKVNGSERGVRPASLLLAEAVDPSQGWGDSGDLAENDPASFCLRKLSSARGDHGVAAEASDAESVACCERGVLHRSGGTPDTPGPGEPGGIVELEAAQPAIGACGRSDDVLALMWRCSRARAESCPREGRFSGGRTRGESCCGGVGAAPLLRIKWKEPASFPCQPLQPVEPDSLGAVVPAGGGGERLVPGGAAAGGAPGSASAIAAAVTRCRRRVT
mmetsp:Transcript_43877/g.112098  ORF Transcript_43877/g.112098 Transcript_43877/m.112098 type:complete len:413 (+) Transcript_43877:227-1465(+)